MADEKEEDREGIREKNWPQWKLGPQPKLTAYEKIFNFSCVVTLQIYSKRFPGNSF
jgi:hypothetical protein